MTSITTRPAKASTSRLRSLLREAALVIGLLAVYDFGRIVAAKRASGAYASASRIWDLERWLHLPSEQGLQHLVLKSPDLTRAANGYYASVHFPLTFAVLIWLFVRRPDAYLRARRALVSATAAGLVIQVLMPTAPPRMLSQFGFVDTGLAYGQSVYGPVGQDKLSNQFAAMPSLHVGWALLLAIVLISSSRTRWRWLWVLHPTVTLLVVVVTGNHFWLDGIVGGVLVLAGLAMAAPPVAAVPVAAPSVDGPPLRTLQNAGTRSGPVNNARMARERSGRHSPAARGCPAQPDTHSSGRAGALRR